MLLIQAGAHKYALAWLSWQIDLVDVESSTILAFKYIYDSAEASERRGEQTGFRALCGADLYCTSCGQVRRTCAYEHLPLQIVLPNEPCKLACLLEQANQIMMLARLSCASLQVC